MLDLGHRFRVLLDAPEEIHAEILMRHQIVGIPDTLPDFYASWEAWSAGMFPVQWMNRLYELPETAGLTAAAAGWT